MCRDLASEFPRSTLVFQRLAGRIVMNYDLNEPYQAINGVTKSECIRKNCDSRAYALSVRSLNGNDGPCSPAPIGSCVCVCMLNAIQTSLFGNFTHSHSFQMKLTRYNCVEHARRDRQTHTQNGLQSHTVSPAKANTGHRERRGTRK